MNVSFRQARPMANKPDPDSIKGPGGLTMRQLHEQIRKSVLKDRQAALVRNTLANKQGRWQRFMHYVWDRKGRT